MSLSLTPLAKAARSLTTRQYHLLKNLVVPARGPEITYRRFHSQFGEDRFVFENIKLPVRGTFVDVGAGHPYRLSNTYFFERNGWNGLCVDADPYHHELLKRHRRTVEWAVVAGEEGECEFSQSYLPAFSTAVGPDRQSRFLKVPTRSKIRVPAFRLETLLIKHGIEKIDLLDIDVEGSEIDVWNSFDYERHQPQVVIIEFETFGLGSGAAQIAELFATLPYQLLHTTCTNFIFVRS